MSNPFADDDLKSDMYNQYKEEYPDFSDTLLKSMVYDYIDMNNSFIKKEQYYREANRHDLQLDEPELSEEEMEERVEDMTYESMYLYKKNMEDQLSSYEYIREKGVADGLTDEEIELQVAEEKQKSEWLY